MTADPHSHIERIFSEALEKPSRDHRAAYLTETCSHKPVVRSRVEALLEAHEQAGRFLASPILELDADEFLAADVSEATGATRVDSERPDDLEELNFLEPKQKPGEIGRFAGYSLTRLLGRGGAGIVFQAFDERLNRVVALKVLAPEWAAQTQARERFLREARAAAAVRHENVVAIHAIDETATLPFLVLEYIEGPTLQDLLADKSRLAASEIVHISRQVASGLAAAHAQRLIHRDIKPANILIQESSGNVKLTDFGLARAADDVRLTQEGVIAGTPQYMSPEQAQGKPVDCRSDLFSLGSVMYTLCSGHPPFRAPTTLAVLRAICDESPVPLETVRQDVPPGLARLIHNLLQKNPGQRPQTAEEIVERLDHVLTETDRSPGSAIGPRSKSRFIGLGVLLLSLPLILGLAFSIWKTGGSEAENIPAENGKNPLASHASQKPQLQPSPDNETASREGREQNPTPDFTLFEESAEPFTEIRRMSVPDVRLYGLAVSPDGRRVYASATDHVIYCWNTEDGEEVDQFKGHTSMAQHIALSPDGSRLISCGGDRTLRLWNTETGNEILQYSSPIPIRSAMFSPDGERLAITFVGGAAGRRMAKLHQQARRPNKANGLAPNPDQVHIFDAETCQPRQALTTADPSQFYDVAWSPDGRYLASGTDRGQVAVFDTAGENPPKELTASGVPGPAYGIHFSHDGKRLFAAGSGNLVWCWKWPGGSEIFSRRFQHGVVRFDLSTDRRWLAMGGALEVRLWVLKDSKERDLLRKLEGHTSPIRNVAFLSGHDVLASCAWDGSVRLWRLPASPKRSPD